MESAIVGEAPIIHQAVALKAAIDAMDTAFAEDLYRRSFDAEPKLGTDCHVKARDA